MIETVVETPRIVPVVGATFAWACCPHCTIRAAVVIGSVSVGGSHPCVRDGVSYRVVWRAERVVWPTPGVHDVVIAKLQEIADQYLAGPVRERMLAEIQTLTAVVA